MATFSSYPSKSTTRGANLTFWAVFRRSYAAAWSFIVALPLIAAVTIGIEGLQHVVEFLEGMYRNRAEMVGHANDVRRMAAGVLKIGWILLLQYWVARFVVSGSARATLAHDPVAIRKFAVVVAVSGAMTLAGIFVPILLLAAHISGLVAALILLFLLVLLFIPQIILIPWSVSAALGDPRASFDFASRRSEGSRLWTVVVYVLTTLPLLGLHYVLGYAAVGQTTGPAIGILVLDAGIVGIMGVVIAANAVMIAERMAFLDSDTLACGPFATNP